MLFCFAEYGFRRWVISSLYPTFHFDVNVLGQFVNFIYWIENSTISYCISVVGVILVFTGHYFRIASMFHAGTNFNHLVQYEKKVDHKLVTSGPYRFSRHPSYFGWTMWALGTQLVLSNSICFVLWCIACYMFFQDRIVEEEYLLIKFFGHSNTSTI